MRNIIFVAALVAAIALAPMVAVANTPDGPAPAPDFRALAFEAGQTTEIDPQAAYAKALADWEADTSHCQTPAVIGALLSVGSVVLVHSIYRVKYESGHLPVLDGRAWAWESPFSHREKPGVHDPDLSKIAMFSPLAAAAGYYLTGAICSR